MSIYTDNGYENRKDYLNNLADDMGIERSTVYNIASILGDSEDFDGLITTLEDLEFEGLDSDELYFFD